MNVDAGADVNVGTGVVSGMVVVPVGGPGGGGVMPAYAVRPAGAGPWPAVVVGFEMFGITDYVRRTAQRLAGLGYVAIVPDFYHRTAPGFEGAADAQGRAQGHALMTLLRREEVAADMRAVLAYLRARPDTCGGTAMAGFSLGGHLAFHAATQVPLAATALMYPGWLDTTGTALSAAGPLLDLAPGIGAQGGGPVLYLAGADDHVVTPEQADRVGRALTAAGVPHEIVVYPDTPHGFLADERDTYRPDVAADAWRRIEALLGSALGRSGDRTVSSG